jgi:protein-export membrane protein SecD
MVVFYRLPGLIADITLVLYTVITLLAMAGIQATLTLPGIAGLILSVGMAVDTNVIIFERIKEEIKVGKTIRAAIDSGFRRAFLTIIDSNVTTLLAAVVLFYFGSGPIKGFAVTLSIGILASMFTAITVTKYFMVLLVRSGVENKWLYGVREGK